LLTALGADAGFRAQVALAWQAAHPDTLDGAGDLEALTGSDAVADLMCQAYLLRPAHWQDRVGRLRGRLEEVERDLVATGAVHWAAEQEATVRAQVDRLTADLEHERSAARELAEQVDQLRRELRRHRADADRARAEARAAQLEAEATVAATRAELAAVQQRAAVAVAAGEGAMSRLDQLRRATRQSRSLDDVRVRLLLDTVLGAADGLRRELALPPLDQHDLRPADLVAPVAVPSTPTASVGPDQARLLLELLALPRVHLVIDGYNVTKTGYPNLVLVEQRRRLVDSLAPLAARTGAEVTCCFDGAAVAGPGASLVRGVRVIFSIPGSSADDLVREIVRAEPAGRPVVVVSSDGEVVAGVTSAGARAVASVTLLAVLSRG
jgi:predicted RNA-binding protein with PIN domain